MEQHLAEEKALSAEHRKEEQLLLEQLTGEAREARAARQRAATVQVSASRGEILDANGNVLRGMSYLRTVYSAFALGDGFA